MYHKILDNCSLAIIIKRLSVKKGCHNSKRIYTIYVLSIMDKVINPHTSAYPI